ncbi:MAG: DUF4493 domain-containing protein [Muribaculaceae bacterium]|nr:DUF4493 domain-containing protein [Muribaculaceae bacterium]
MNFFKTFISSILLSSLIVSCADESPWSATTSDGAGKIKLHLSSSTDVESKIPIVRSVSTVISTPPSEEFKIRMTSANGEYSKLWSSVSEFEKEEGFAAGTYLLEAIYGSEDSQGVVKNSEKGHEHAYFYGKTESVQIEAGKETNVQLMASLANSIVVIEYTDAFKNYFNNWSTELVTRGSSSLNIGNEEGMCYVVPGDVDVVITAEQQNGKSVRINPAVFEAEPQHMYKIRYNIYNGEIGQADKLELIFDDDSQEVHNVTVDLTDELFNGTAPVITPEGFIFGETLETLEGIPYNGDVKFTVDASGGLESAILTISSDTYQPDFLTDGMIDLCTPDASLQEKLKSEGVRALGFTNPERMALLDLSEFCRSLPVGTHTISLLVKDKYMRSSEADANVKMSTVPIEVNFEVVNTVFGSEEGEVLVYYNGYDPVSGNNPFSFKVGVTDDSEDSAEDVNILTINDEPYSRAFETKAHKFKISMPYGERDEFPVHLYFNGSYKGSKNISVTYPDYDMEYDPMARRVMMRLGQTEPNKAKFKNLAYAQRRLRVFLGGEEKQISPDEDGVITLTGFEPASSTGEIKTTMKAGTPDGDDFKTLTTLTTIAESGVPNGDFSETENYWSGQINQGGQYRPRGGWSGSNGQYNPENYNILVPVTWSNLNQKTCNYDYTNIKNTWFMVPCSYLDGSESRGEVKIRSVGFNYNGIEPAQEDGSLLNSISCNHNVPDKGHTAAGKLFLGSYDIQIEDYSIVSETYDQGIEFTNRPLKLKGNYKYSPCLGTDDKGFVEVSLVNGDKILTYSKLDLGEASDWTEFTVDLVSGGYQYPVFNEKPTHLRIMFSSSNKASDNWQEEDENVPTIAITDYVQKFLGSELTISDLRFEY